MSGPPRVLLIDGLWGSSDWYSDALTGRCWTKLRRDSTRRAVLAAWAGVHLETCSFQHGKSEDAILACERAVCHGGFHALVVADLCQADVVSCFETRMGHVLRNFANNGGAIAFPSSDGPAVTSFLWRVFGTQWKTDMCYDSEWEPHKLDGKFTLLASTFTHGTPVDCLTFSPFHATAWALQGVPNRETLFHSPCRSASLGDRDVCVAVHEVGSGSITFFGDINCESPM